MRKKEVIKDIKIESEKRDDYTICVTHKLRCDCSYYLSHLTKKDLIKLRDKINEKLVLKYKKT